MSSLDIPLTTLQSTSSTQQLPCHRQIKSSVMVSKAMLQLSSSTIYPYLLVVHNYCRSPVIYNYYPSPLDCATIKQQHTTTSKRFGSLHGNQLLAHDYYNAIQRNTIAVKSQQYTTIVTEVHNYCRVVHNQCRWYINIVIVVHNYCSLIHNHRQLYTTIVVVKN